MKKLLKPYWWLVTITIPQIFIFPIYGLVFKLIKTQLGYGNINTWTYFATGLSLIWLFFTCYGIFLMVKKRETNPRMGLAVIFTYIPLLYFYSIKSTEVIPSTVSRWMLLGISPEISGLTFIMPGLAYAMFLLLYWKTPADQKHKLITNIKFIYGIPLFWLVSLLLIIPISTYFYYHDQVTYSVFLYSLLFLLVISVIAIIFFVIRLLYLFLQKEPEVWEKALTPFILILPCLCLLFINATQKFLGDFSGPGFYVLTFLTGVLTSAPYLAKLVKIEDSVMLRIVLFIGKSILLPFSLYLFIVFLPYLPISILLLFIGIGFLLLAPLVLTMVHIRSMWLDYEYLLKKWSKQKLLLIFFICILILPCSILLSFNNDRVNLERSLDFLYRQSLSDNRDYHFNINNIQTTLKKIAVNRLHTDQGILFGFSGRI